MTIKNLIDKELSTDLRARSIFKSIDNDQTVKLLLNFDNDFEDESQYNHRLERFESVSLNTNIKKFGNSSAYFNGSCYLAYSDSDEFFFGVEDFTIEFWMYPTNNSIDGQGLMGQRAAYNSDNSWIITYYPVSNCFYFQYTLNGTSNVDLTFGTTLSINNWHHIAVCRKGTFLYCFVDGVLYSKTVSDLAFYNSSQRFLVGAISSSYYFTGYIDNLIIHKGLCKYTSSTSINTSTEQTLDSNTKLLIHGNQNNKNTENRTIYAYGDSNINTTYYKFGDGAGYFDGSGDYLTIPYSSDFDFGTGDFTLEFQLKMPVFNNSYLIATNTSGGMQFIIGYGNNNAVAIGRHNVAWDTSFSVVIPLNIWCHLVLQRRSGYLECYLDGYLVGRAPNTIDYNFQSNIITLMTHGTLANYYNGYVDEIRISKAIARYQYSNFTPSVTAYTTDQYTKLLLHAEGSDNSVIFTDSSENAKLIILKNNATISSANYKFSPTSLFLDGINDYVAVPAYNGFNFNTDDFTIDCWVYVLSISGYCPILEARPSASYSNYLLGIDSSYKVDFVISSGRLTSTNTISLNQWQHIALIRTSGVLKCFINGILDSTTYSYSSTLNTGREYLLIGTNVDGHKFNGYIDEFRISKNIARWTENFTPSTSEYTTDQYTELLLHMNGSCSSIEFIDSSGTNKSIIKYGDTTYSSDVYKFNNYSGYFDGTGDCLKTLVNTDFYLTSDFTCEAYVYITIQKASGHIISITDESGYYEIRLFLSALKPAFYIYHSNTYQVQLISPNNVNTNQWIHLAISRYGDIHNLFVDGVVVASISKTHTVPSVNWRCYIGFVGTGSDSQYNFQGYIDEVKISKNIARWTENFTPPTSPYETDQYTKLLLHFNYDNSNQTFIDNSSIPKTITRISDTRLNIYNYKFGQSSAYFDGSDDYIKIAPSIDFNFGTNDFTMECWVFASSIPSVSRLCASGSQADGAYKQWFWGWGTTWGGGTKINFGYWNGSANVDLTSSAIGVALNEWNHFAITRYNGYINFFFNGISCGSVTLSNSISINSGVNGLQVGARFNTNNTTVIEYVNGHIDELRISNTARWTSNFTPSTEQYTSDQYTLLLLHFDGQDCAPKLIDSSQASILPAVIGSPIIKTNDYKIGSSSIYFDGNANFLSYPSSTDYDFLSNDFTIDFWIKALSPSQSTNTVLVCRRDIATEYAPFNILMTPGTYNIRLCCSSTSTTSWDAISDAACGTLTQNVWSHVAICRASQCVFCFLDGVLQSTTNIGTKSLLINNKKLLIGGGNYANTYFNGYIDELRISKGIARWTANFTPPSSTHTTDQYTKLLMHFPSTDKNQIGKTITRYGDAKISTSQYKFGNSSGYFDGTGDWLKIGLVNDLQFGSDNFTIDCWVRLSVINKRHDIYSASDTDDYNLIVFEIDANNKLKLWMSSNGTSWNIANGVIGTYSFSANTWYHVALVRNSDSFKAYVDGIVDLSVTSSTSLFPANSGFSIGNAVFTGMYYFYGYIDEFRISKGIARWTENFTPPTAPYTTDQYTKLLLHFDAPDNTGTFIDSSQSMDRFTDESNSLDLFQDSYDTSRLFIQYNTPQISTNIYKFNSAALYFNGTSYITSPNSGDFNFGTEDFTIQFWMYSPILWSSQNAQAGIIGQKYSDSTYGWVISRDGNNPTKLNFRGALTNNFPTLSTPAQNTWEHWCVTRKSGQLYWFKNGVLDSASNTNTNNLTDVQADLYIGSAQTWGQKANVYLDDIVILKGVSIISNLSVPSEPSSANLSNKLQVYSDSITISNKQYSAKFVSDTNSLDKYTYTKFNQNLDLSKYKYLVFRLYPTISGSKIKFGLNNYNVYNDIISGGTATSDSESNSSYITSYGCDNNSTTRWTSANTSFPHWWKYDFGTTKIIKSLGILKYYDSNGCIVKNFTFSGSNDDLEYILLYTGIASPSLDKIWEYFNFNNTTAYRYYKISVTSNYRTDYYVGFWEIEFYDQDINQIEYTPNITNTHTWQNVYLNLSNYSWQQKYNIDKLLITITNASINNTFYIDDIYACNDLDLPIVSFPYSFTAYKDLTNKLSGLSSLKFISNITDSLNKKIIRKLTTPVDLSNKSKIVLAIYSNRTGSNFKVKFINSKPTELITKTTDRTYHLFNANTTFNPGASGQVNVTVLGAGGAGGGCGGWKVGSPGGPGGKATGILTVTAQDYLIRAGAGGMCHGTVVINGQATMDSTGNYYGGQGGGYTGIFQTSISQANALLIAGGGGGGGSSRWGKLNFGGAGGGLVGSNGNSPYDNKFHYAGIAASQISAGADATSDSANYSGGQAALQAGRPRTYSYGGSGGGGYWGGSAGGYSESHTMGGGGGGSGYINPTYVSNGVLSTGDGNAGGEESENGQGGTVLINYLSSDFPEKQATILVEHTPNILNINQWELFEIDISNISTAYKSSIDKIEIEMINASAETIFYLDYIFATSVYYIDPATGDNTRTGLSWATAWKTIAGGATSARIKSGDLIKIAKSPDPISIGPAQWNNVSKTVTLSNTPDGNLTTVSLISKNKTTSNGSEGWYPIQSITGLDVLINNHYANSGSAGRGYYGDTENTETYRRETYKLASNTDCTIQLSGDYYQNNAGLIKFEGGYNTNTNIQDGETFLDAVSGGGNGFDLSNKQYISINKLNIVRANYGIVLSSASNNIINAHTIAANTLHSLYLVNAYNNIINIKNIINNGNDGIRLVTTSCMGNRITTDNINNNLAVGIAFTYSYNNELYAINICNNNNTNIYLVQYNNNNKFKVLNNKYSLVGFGIDFGSNNNDNDFYNISFSNNFLGSIKTVNGNQNYFFNTVFSDTIKIASFTANCGHKIFSNAENNDTNLNYVYSDAGTVYSQNIIRHTSSGLAWALCPTSVYCNELNPVETCVARILCIKDIAIVASIWMMRINENITGRFIIKKYQVPDLDEDIYADIVSINTWERLILIFKSSIDCVIEVHAQAFGGTIYSVYIDDFSCVQYNI